MTYSGTSPLYFLPLDDGERDVAVDAFDRDGFVILPRRLGAELIAEAQLAIRHEALLGGATGRSFRCDDLLPRAEVFRTLATIPSVLQLALDLIGPTLQLIHSNLFFRPSKQIPAHSNEADRDYLSATPWHADGPTLAHHPRIHGVPALISLKVGMFLSPIERLEDGPLQVMKGTHRLVPGTHDHSIPADLHQQQADQTETLLVPAGTVVLFHTATWHAAPPVTGEKTRMNCYFNFGPHWAATWDRALGLAAPADWPPAARVLQQGASSPRATQFPGASELNAFAPWRRHTVRAPSTYA